MAGIYIHIPFCRQKCTYCDFTSFPDRLGYAEAYMACVYKEMELRKEELKDVEFDTVYFGGGTPSCVKVEYIEKVLLKLKEKFEIDKNCEISIECNPASADKRKLEKYKEVKTLVEHLTIETTFAALGASNAFQLQGELPRDREKLLSVLDEIIENVSEEELQRYRKSVHHL